jgi:hypothetical protein
VDLLEAQRGCFDEARHAADARARKLEVPREDEARHVRFCFPMRTLHVPRVVARRPRARRRFVEKLLVGGKPPFHPFRVHHALSPLILNGAVRRPYHHSSAADRTAFAGDTRSGFSQRPVLNAVFRRPYHHSSAAERTAFTGDTRSGFSQRPVLNAVFRRPYHHSSAADRTAFAGDTRSGFSQRPVLNAVFRRPYHHSSAAERTAFTGDTRSGFSQRPVLNAVFRDRTITRRLQNVRPSPGTSAA